VEDGGFGSCILGGIAFSYRHPFQALVPMVLPVATQLVACIHALWEPGALAAMTPAVCAALSVVGDEDHIQQLQLQFLGTCREGRFSMVLSVNVYVLFFDW